MEFENDAVYKDKFGTLWRWVGHVERWERFGDSNLWPRDYPPPPMRRMRLVDDAPTRISLDDAFFVGHELSKAFFSHEADDGDVIVRGEN